MTEQIKHTPHTEGPWRAGDDKDGGIAIFGKLGRVAVMDSCPLNFGDDAANAAFIVRAVNSHEKLVAIKEAARKFLITTREAATEAEYVHYEDELKRALADFAAAGEV